MSKRSGLLTKTQRNKLNRQGCSGCIVQLLLAPFEMVVALFKGFGKGAKELGKRKGKW
jgi:hypothetical protein